MEKELVTNKHIIEFKSDFPIKLGDVLYSVEETLSQYFYGICEVCKGEGEITFNGYTFSCPKCNGVKHSTLVLRVDTYTVYRYRVAKIFEKLEMFDFNPAKGFNRQVRIELFRPAPRGDYLANNKSIALLSTYGKGLNTLELNKNIYFDYKAAVAEADRLNAEQEAIVKKYNEDFGTDFVFKKPKYDLKSK